MADEGFTLRTGGNVAAVQQDVRVGRQALLPGFKLAGVVGQGVGGQDRVAQPHRAGGAVAEQVQGRDVVVVCQVVADVRQGVHAFLQGNDLDGTAETLQQCRTVFQGRVDEGYFMVGRSGVGRGRGRSGLLGLVSRSIGGGSSSRIEHDPRLQGHDVGKTAAGRLLHGRTVVTSGHGEYLPLVQNPSKLKNANVASGHSYPRITIEQHHRDVVRSRPHSARHRPRNPKQPCLSPW